MNPLPDTAPPREKLLGRVFIPLADKVRRQTRTDTFRKQEATFTGHRPTEERSAALAVHLRACETPTAKLRPTRQWLK